MQDCACVGFIRISVTAEARRKHSLAQVSLSPTRPRASALADSGRNTPTSKGGHESPPFDIDRYQISYRFMRRKKR